MGPEVVSVPTFEQSAQKLAAYVVDSIPKAGNFVVEQAPDVLRQIVYLDIAQSVAGGSMFLIAAIVMTVLLRPIFRLSARKSEDTGGASVIPSILAIVACVAMFVNAAVCFHGAVGPAVAPKAWILQRAGILK